MLHLKALSEAVGVSGGEDEVRQVVINAIYDHVQDIQVDSLGSVTAFKPGTESRMRVMLDAHMDEVGFMVTGFDSEGLIRFTPVGGIDDRILPGLRVVIGDDKVPGVIMWLPIHLNREQNVTKISSLRIDIGATSKDDASGKVKRGDRIAFDSQYMEVGDVMLRGKAFDDRVGCSLLVDVLRAEPYPVDIVASFSVQEEIGLRGARVSAQRLEPDFAIALEGAPAQDIPNPTAEADDTDEANPSCRLGDGPVLTVMDRSMIVPPQIVAFLRQTAEKHDIPYQYKTQLGGGTDAGSIHMSNAGVPSAVISVPCRYIHSPAAYLNRRDYEATLRLLQAVLREITPDVTRQV